MDIERLMPESLNQFMKAKNEAGMNERQQVLGIWCSRYKEDFPEEKSNNNLEITKKMTDQIIEDLKMTEKTYRLFKKSMMKKIEEGDIIDKL